MAITVLSLTVLFENPFWIGVVERRRDSSLEVCRIVFGAEPKDYDVYEFMLKNYLRLKFSAPTKAESSIRTYTNPKREQRAIKRQTLAQGIGTKAQQALQQMREANKTEHKAISREQRAEAKQRKRELHILQRKEKHKGH